MKLPDLIGMNDAQRQAVTHGEGPALVLAGPGSGKTFTITNRISWLIAGKGVLPEHILVITFTREAALSMQERFRRQCAELPVLSLPVNFGTFHAIFYQILQQSRGSAADHLLKDSEKIKLILPIVADYKKKMEQSGCEIPFGEHYEDAARLLSAVSYYKNTGNASNAARLLEEAWRPGFEGLLRAYEKARGRDGRLDFDDMVYGCLKLLKEDQSLLESWRKRFRYILIDEFQDINPIQYQVVRLLAPSGGNIFCVGDDDQSIYGFRGSDPSLMRRFLEDYPGARQLLLNVNYRSRAEIVEASLKVVSRNKNRFPKELTAAGKTGEQKGTDLAKKKLAEKEAVSLLGFPDKEQEYQYLRQCLLVHRDRGDLGECAVLFRTNAQMQGFAASLKKAGLPYQMKEKAACIYDHFVVRDIMNYLEFAAGRRDRGLFLTIMNKPSRYISRDALTREQVDFPALRDYYRRYTPPERLPVMLERLGRLEKDLARLKNLKPYLAVQFLRRGMGYEGYLRQKAAANREKEREWLDILDWLSTDAQAYDSLKEWQTAQEAFRTETGRNMKQMQRNVREKQEQIGNPQRETQEQAGNPQRETQEQAGNPQRETQEQAGNLQRKTQEQVGNPQNKKPEGVRLMTVHASKGLEFHTVYIPDINEGVYPHGRMVTEETAEEERRMLYVAMTRAKEALELLFVQGTKERPELPSRYLNPLI